jgi:hypothetical protein
MGRPLRKLHQIHSKPPLELDICNIRTSTGSRNHSCPKLMEAQGFVSKNRWLEKAGCTKISHGADGI